MNVKLIMFLNQGGENVQWVMNEMSGKPNALFGVIQQLFRPRVGQRLLAYYLREKHTY
jgi:hypothetical protein